MHDGRIYNLNITCGAEYPDKASEGEEERENRARARARARPARAGPFLSSCLPHARSLSLSPPPSQPPEVAFLSKVNMGCVTPSGQVDPRAFPTLGAWRCTHTLERVLTDLRADMASPANRRLPQPPEGSTYQ